MSNKLLTPSSTETLTIRAGARSSPLSRVQVKEVQEAINAFFPNLKIDAYWVETSGDKDLETSLRTMDKTDFFTREIDNLLLEGECRIGVHSAKDLPDPLPKGLRIVAVTEGVDPSDVLVLRQGESLQTLRQGSKIATSSVRREEMVKQLRSDLEFIDLRGNIGQRIAKLEAGDADGIVVAEAALIRLGLTHHNRVVIPGETVAGQGQLAIVARDDDAEMQALFSVLDVRKTSLYLGLNCPDDQLASKYLHYPIIAIIPRNPENPNIREAFLTLPTSTHLVFTSQNSVTIFLQCLEKYALPRSSLQGKTIVAVGKKTAQFLEDHGIKVDIVPEEETAEGITRALDHCDLSGAHFFWPHSALSRAVLREFFEAHNFPYTDVVVYDTVPQQPGPHPAEEAYQTIVFTSPSTVDAYLKFFGSFPKDKELKAIGPVTAMHLAEKNDFY